MLYTQLLIAQIVSLDPLSPFNALAKRSLPDEITVYDSTLRDGEQMPGVRFSCEQKVAIARRLDEVGVHQIEAGFPAVSETEMESVRAVAGLGLDADILCLARTKEEDIDLAIKCDVDMVLLFVATSEMHMRYKLKAGREQVLERAVRTTEYGRDHGLKVSMSTEDSTRSDLEFMLELYNSCEDAGVDRIGVTDTLGCASPEAVSHLVREIRRGTSTAISAHLHNDFGLAVANSVAALSNGAEAIATTVGGLGERAGNVSLEQLVMVLKNLYGKDIGISTEGLTGLGELVFQSAGIKMPINQPWIGANAFSHESGIHVAAVLNCPMTYECVSPEAVGNRRHLVLGKHSGTAIVLNRLGERGVTVSQEEICKIVREIKRIGEKQGRVSDTEFWAIVDGVLGKPEREDPCRE
ncbi:MAG: homoaconitate hydratase [Methanobacteriota archaeon]|nr:MAG: homoaconitate hydratase [Euryarchaeota archaeon]